MGQGKAEDAGGLTPAKDDNPAPYHFDPRTLPIFKCVDYKIHALSPRDAPAGGSAESKQKDTPKRVFLLGADGGNRTHNLLITSEMLYH